MLASQLSTSTNVFIPSAPAVKIESERLPFVVRFVSSDQERDAVRELRHLAYARRSAYQPDFVKTLRKTEGSDENQGRIILGAFDKETDRLLGTVRLALSKQVEGLLPSFVGEPDIADVPFTFVDRFAVRPGVNRRVGPTLMKALWLWSKAKGSQALVALAMKTLVGHYARWGGLQLQGDGEPLNVPEHLNEPVYLLGTLLKDVLAIIGRNNPAFVPFLERTHTDILVAPPAGYYHA